tara:strand:+ start:231 stop:425 length:195 start_codon:yes stop_codon:yes gene_type:complete
MSKISEIDLASSVLSFFILLGFIATAIAFVRLAIIGINYIKVNYFKDEGEVKKNKTNKSEKTGF